MKRLNPLFLPVWLLLIIGLGSLAACLPAAPAAPTLAALAPTPLPATSWPPTAIPTTTPKTTLTPTTAPPPTQTLVPTATPTPVCATPGRIETGYYPSLVDGPQRVFRIYLPPCYGQDGRVYPVLYLLHGNGQDETKWDSVGIDEAADRGVFSRLLPPVIIVMPAGGWAMYHTSGGPWSFEAVIVDYLVPYIDATYCTWRVPAGRAIGGISRGGYWALEIAFRHPADFASVGGHSAALLDTAAGPDLNPQYTGLTPGLGALRVYLDAGANDLGVLSNLERLHEDMVDAGIPHEWYLNEGGHDDTYWTSQSANYLAWYAAPWPQDRQQYPPCPQATQHP